MRFMVECPACKEAKLIDPSVTCVVCHFGEPGEPQDRMVTISVSTAWILQQGRG